jgi:ribosomal protein S18 acetylase RimI-like enzyme
MKTATVRTVTTVDTDRVVGVIAVAFVADPAMRWFYPDPHQYLASFPMLVRAFGQKAFEHGWAHEIADFAASALWLPPGVRADETVLRQVIQSTVDSERVPQLFETLGQLGRYHPTEPHWYLPFIGVDAPRQGRGLGSALLRHALEQVDQKHRRAYLETATPRNIWLYEHHGFELVGRVEGPSAPTLFPMVRPAR